MGNMTLLWDDFGKTSYKRRGSSLLLSKYSYYHLIFIWCDFSQQALFFKVNYHKNYIDCWHTSHKSQKNYAKRDFCGLFAYLIS